LYGSVLQDYIQRLMAEKADLDKRFHGMKDELIMRLQNACAQRDEARAQVRGICCTSARMIAGCSGEALLQCVGVLVAASNKGAG
jgi:hypothetical protein